MGGCTGIPETDFLKPLSLSASPLPPGSPPSLGTELARLDPRWRSEWSSLRLRRILPCGSLMLLLRQSRLITFWETVSSKRCRCFLGMKILANMAAYEENKLVGVNCFSIRVSSTKSKEMGRGWIYITDPPRSILKTQIPQSRLWERWQPVLEEIKSYDTLQTLLRKCSQS